MRLSKKFRRLLSTLCFVGAVSLVLALVITLVGLFKTIIGALFIGVFISLTILGINLSD